MKMCVFYESGNEFVNSILTNTRCQTIKISSKNSCYNVFVSFVTILSKYLYINPAETVNIYCYKIWDNSSDIKQTTNK